MPEAPRCDEDKRAAKWRQWGEEGHASCELVQDKAAVLQMWMGHVSQPTSIPQEPHGLFFSTAMWHFGKWGLVTNGPCDSASPVCEIRQGINLEVKGTEIMCLACGKRHDMATEAKSQRQILVRPLEMMEEYPEHYGLNLLPCNCLSVRPSLLTLILSKGLLCSCYCYLLKNKTKSTQEK